MKDSIISRTPKIRRFLEITALASATFAVFSALTAKAADIHWQGPAASYTNAADWVGGAVPGSVDNAINDNGTANAVQINVGDPNWTVGQIRAGNSAGNGAFVQNGQTVTPLGTNYNGPVISEFFTPFRLGIVAADTGIYTLNGGTLSYGTGPLNVGEVGTGTLNINGGTITGSGVFYVNAGGIAVPNPAVITATAGHGPYLGDFTYFQQGYYTPDVSKGLPSPGSTVSNGAADHSYTLASSYTAPNAVVLDAAVNSVTITLATPTVCSGLSFLCSAGNGPATNNYTVHYASGADDTGTLIVEDWFFPQAYQPEKEVLDGNGRVDGLGLNFQITTPVSGYAGNPPYLWSLDSAPLANTDKVVSIHLTFVGGGGQFSTATFMGVSGQTTVGGPFTPLAITGYNADVVVEAGAPNPRVSASVMDTVNQTGGTNNVPQLWVAQGQNAHATYNLHGGEINSTDWNVIGRAGGYGTMNIDGGTFTHTSGGQPAFIIGSGAGDNSGLGSIGVLNQSAGTINCNSEYWLGENTSCVGTNTISGTAAVNINSWLSIGRGGLGVVNISGGTVHKNNNGAFIVADGGDAIVNISGGTVTTDGELWVGNSGGGHFGTINMGGGLLVANNWFQVGRGDATALLNFTGGTIHKTSANGGNFIIGDNHAGQVVQTGGTFIDDNSFWIGNNTSGEYDFSNGTLNVGGELWIGQGGPGSGIMNLNGGAVTNNSWLAIGRESAQGTLNIISGSMTKAGGGNISIAHNSGANGTVNQSGGVFTCASGELWVGENAGTGTWNINGGTASFNVVHLAQNSDAVGIVQLDGGIFIANEISMPSAGSSTFNFNGGTLRAGVSTANFMHGLTAANVQAGGAVIDSQAFDITVAQPLADNGGGGLTKLGSGALTLSGANSYTGPTVVNGGKLITTTDSTGGGNITVKDAAGLGVKVQAANAQLNAANVTLATSAAASLDFDLGAFGNPTAAPLNVLNTLAVNGTITVNIADAVPHVGQFPLIKYAAKSGAGSFVIGSLRAGVAATIVDNTANKSIDLNITVVNLPRWEGLAGGNWDIGLTTNWINIGDGLPTFYSQGNGVLFNDSALGTTTVNLTTTIIPDSVTINNSSLAYTFNGSGKISGNTALAKQGSGVATIANTGGNDFTGPTVIAGGVLRVSSLANGGSPSAIGASSASPTNLVLANGTLSYSGPAVAINRGYSVQDTNSSIETVSDLTLSGVATANLGSGFVKTGPARLAYTTVGNNNLSATHYEVQAGSLLLDGSAGPQTNSISGHLGINGVVSASVTLTNTTLNCGDFYIGNVAAMTGSAEIDSGTTINDNSWYILGDGANAVASTTMNGGTLNVPNGRLFLCSAPGTMATFNLNGGTINKSGDYFAVVNGGWNGTGARTGVVNQVNGTINSSSELWVGDSGGAGNQSLGIYNLSGGTLTVNNWFGVGRDGSSGIFHMTGGTLNKGVNGDMVIGRGGSSGTFIMSGGTLNKDNVNPLIVGQGQGIGEFDQSGGTVTMTSEYWVGVDNGTLATNNISGSAVLNVDNWVSLGRSGQAVVNFSGGTITKTGGGNFIVGDNGNAHFTQTGGALTINSELWIGQAGGGVGQYDLSAGTVINNSWLAIGRESAQGILNISGGSMTKAGGGNISITHNSGASGTVNMTGGSFTCASGETWIGENGGPAIWNMGGGTATLGYVQLARNSDATGTLNLNGGTFTANEITTGSSGTSTLNFNGGTLGAGASTVNFLHGLTSANVLAGGAVIDSGANVISVAQPLVDGGGAGGLTKIGTGTLYLNGANTYTGPTLVNAGTLGGTGIIAGPVTVASGATLAPGASVGTLTVNDSVTLGGTIAMEISKDGGVPTTDLLAVSGNLAFGGKLTVVLTGANALAFNDTFKLFNWGTRSGSFAAISLPAGYLWDTSQLNVNGTIRVAGLTPPVVKPPTVAGGNLILTGAGGPPGASYTWLTSSNVAAPLPMWTTNTTGVFDSSGGFSNAFPISHSVPAAFFQLRTP